jgi:hypothetical protein
MKKIFLILMALILTILLFAFSGCESDVSGVGKLNDSYIDIWVDEETGVQYVVYAGFKQGGITPRLNADGTPYQGNEKGGENNA